MDFRKIAFISMLVVALIAGAAVVATAQTATPYVYEKTIGDSVTVAWDHVPFLIRCKDGDALKEFARGVNGSLVCGAVTYPVTWTSNVVKVAKFNADGTDWTGLFRYNYRGILVTPTAETETIKGEVVNNEIAAALNTVGTIRFEVQAVMNNNTSTWAKSTDAAVSMVGGVARGWVVNVKSPPTPVEVKPIKGMILK